MDMVRSAHSLQGVWERAIKAASSQVLLFLLGMPVFLLCAVLGWVKLRHGFNFIDEGYHMVESWRLTAGDHFLKDGLTDILLLYTHITAVVFDLFPGITLLDFRRIQYLLTMVSLAVMAFAMVRVNREFWHLPLIFSLFAFTGLDPVGTIPNLNYYTYSHAFLAVYVSLLILGVTAAQPYTRALLFIASGVFLWLMGFNALYLCAMALSPVALFVIFGMKSGDRQVFTIRDLVLALAPFFLLWALFLFVHGTGYISSVVDATRFSVAHHWTFRNLNGEAVKHVAVTFSFLCLMCVSLTRFPPPFFMGVAALCSLAMACIIETSLFGLIAPYYNGWFAKPMWLASLMLSVIIVLFLLFASKRRKNLVLTESELAAIIIIVPSTLQFLLMSVFSTNGVLTALHTSIPIVAAGALAVAGSDMFSVMPRGYKAIFLVAVLFPFFLADARADWNFTFFDMRPEHLRVMLDKGFGRGIKTNETYKKLYDWVLETSAAFTRPDDFIISYVTSPMVYMIARRRPALDHTFTDFASRPPEFFEESVRKMVRLGRRPAAAYMFDRYPALWPAGENLDMYELFRRQTILNRDDPITRYVSATMVCVQSFCVAGDFVVRFFVDKDRLSELAERKRADNPPTQR